MSNMRSILMLLGGCLLLAAAHLFLSVQGVGDALVKRTVLVNSDDGELDGISVERAGKTVFRLARDGAWRIVEPFQAMADTRKVLMLSDALTASRVKERYTRAELEAFGRDREDYGLDAEDGVKVAAVRGGVKSVVSLGVATASGDGVFASVEGDPLVYIAETNILAAVSAGADSFRERAVCPGGAADVDSFDLRRGKGRLSRFFRENGVWKRESPAGGPALVASAAKIDEFLSIMGSAEATSFAWPAGAKGEPSTATSTLLASYGLDGDDAVVVTLHSPGAADRQIAFGRSAGDGSVYVLAQDSGAVLVAASSLKDAAASGDFQDSRLFPFDPKRISRISLSGAGETYLVARDGENRWRFDSPVSAPCDRSAAEAFLAKLLSLSEDDRDEQSGISVSVLADAPAAKVSPDALFGDMAIEDLRSREILRIAPGDVRRVTSSFSGANSESVAVVRDRDLGTWKVESSVRPAAASREAVEALLSALDPLRAAKTVKLKATRADLRSCGLDNPVCTVSIDLAGEGAPRRNILLGRSAQGGRFAATGAADSVFVISGEAAGRLMAPLCTE